MIFNNYIETIDKNLYALNNMYKEIDTELKKRELKNPDNCDNLKIMLDCIKTKFDIACQLLNLFYCENSYPLKRFIQISDINGNNYNKDDKNNEFKCICGSTNIYFDKNKMVHCSDCEKLYNI